MLRVTIRHNQYIVTLNRIPVARVDQEGNLLWISDDVDFIDIRECMSNNTDVWVEEPLEPATQWVTTHKKEKKNERARLMEIWNQA